MDGCHGVEDADSVGFSVYGPGQTIFGQVWEQGVRFVQRLWIRKGRRGLREVLSKWFFWGDVESISQGESERTCVDGGGLGMRS